MAHFMDHNGPNEAEISAMAAVLTRRYGNGANDLARHFVVEHEAVGDHVRADIWSRVGACLQRIELKPTLS